MFFTNIYMLLQLAENNGNNGNIDRSLTFFVQSVKL